MLERFSSLMSEALRCSGSPEGLGLSLEEVQARLVELAEQERASAPVSSVGGLPDFSETRRQELERCRLAVYAFVDENLLNSPRPDAAAWLPLSLQCRYFRTTEAGQHFFTSLDKTLDALNLPREEEDLADRLERAAAMAPDAPGMDVLRVFALCLLYGFRGCLYGQPELLDRVRKACLALLEAGKAKDGEDRAPAQERGLLRSLEPFAYILIPIFTCIAFGLYCADILSNTPIKGF